MKKIRVKAVVYDRTTQEYIQKTVTHTISDELAMMIKKEFSDSYFGAIDIQGFGAGSDMRKIPGIRSLLCSQKRFFIEPQFHVLDDDGKEIAGWRGF